MSTLSKVNRFFSFIFFPLLLLLGRPAQAVSLDDSFDAGLPFGMFTYVPKADATIEVKGGKLRISVPDTTTYDHWSSIDDAPQVRAPVGNGDFTFETKLELPGNPEGNFNVALIVVFGRYDVFYWGPNRAWNRPRAERTGRGGVDAILPDDFAGPLWLRIRRTGSIYHFEYKTEEKGEWKSAGIENAPQVPRFVGFMVKTWSPLALDAEFDYIKLDNYAVDKAKGGISAKVTLNGQPLPNAFLQVFDAGGKPITDVVTLSSDINGIAYAYNVPPGDVKVRAVSLTSDPSTLVDAKVEAGKLASISIPDIKAPDIPPLCFNSESLAQNPGITKKGWQLLPLPRNTRNAEGWAYTDPAKPDYDTGKPDPKYKVEWLSDIEVPRNYGQGNPASPDESQPIQMESIFWYRIEFTFPDVWKPILGKRDLIIKGYNVDDEDQTWFNGRLLGGHFFNEPNVWTIVREYTIPADAVNPTGVNVLAIQGGQGGWGAGLSGETGSNPCIAPGPAETGSLEVLLLDPQGKPLLGRQITISSPGGAHSVTKSVLDDKPILFSALPAGLYEVMVSGPGINPARGFAEVKAGQKTSLTIRRPSLPFMDLSSSALAAAGLPGWKLLPAASEDRQQLLEDTDITKIDRKDSGKDPVYNRDWLENVNVPGDYGKGDPANPNEAQPIDNDSIFVYRLHVKIPAEWKDAIGNGDLVLANFNVDDEDYTYFNGEFLGSHTFADTRFVWTIRRFYILPKDKIRWGEDNVITIKGGQGTWGAGITEAAPVLVATTSSIVEEIELGVPAPPPPAAVCGDANGDGRVAINDAILTLQIAVGTRKATDAQLAALDLNGDGRVTIAEVILVLRKAVNPAFALAGKNCK